MNPFDKLRASLFTKKSRGHILDEDLSDYIDGSLSQSERQRTESHIEACARCRDQMETLRATVALLRRVPSVPAPRSFALRQASVARTRPLPLLGGLRLATALTAGLLLLVLAGDLLRVLPAVPAPAAQEGPMAAPALPAAAPAPPMPLAPAPPMPLAPAAPEAQRAAQAPAPMRPAPEQDERASRPRAEPTPAATPPPVVGARVAGTPTPAPAPAAARAAPVAPAAPLATAPAPTPTPALKAQAMAAPSPAPTATATQAPAPPAATPPAATLHPVERTMPTPPAPPQAQPGPADTWRLIEMALGAALVGLFAALEVQAWRRHRAKD